MGKSGPTQCIADEFTLPDSMLTVRSFFQDPNYVKQVLVANYKVMNEEQADALLDSTVNITMVGVAGVTPLTTPHVSTYPICTHTHLTRMFPTFSITYAS